MFLEQLWASGNLPMSLASEQVFVTVPESERPRATKSPFTEAISFMAPFNRADAHERRQLCEALAIKAQGGRLDYVNVAQADAKALLAIFNANGKPPS